MAYYYVTDSYNSGEVRTTNLKSAMEIGKEWIEDYRGDAGNGEGCPEGVGQIEIYKSSHVLEYPEEDGLLVARSTQIVLAERPNDVDEDGYSESDGKVYYWGDFESMCEYEMQRCEAA